MIEAIIQKNPIQNDPEQLMNEHRAAELLGYSIRALQVWRMNGKGPKFIKVSARSIRYRRRDLIDWIDGNTRMSTSDTGRPA